MPLQMSTHATTTETYKPPLHTLRWSAVFAGLVVGIATNLFLMLLGAAAGLAVFNVGETQAETIPLAAAIWNALSMIVAAFAGGYVAARTAGMRRASDGILHGVVAWGVTMLVSAFIVTTLTSATLASLFGAATANGGATAAIGAGGGAAADVAGSIEAGDRAEAISTLRDRLGISNEQASRLVDQALILSGREEAASAAGRDAAQDTLRTASMASGWLSAAILLSLLAAMGGGLLGARGTRREVRRSVAGTASPVL